ncbi:YmfQ family protein [Falsiroseomonas sp.]|uniref:YmfQ family protein n=1 Tax=Falsiroseomonas sp. TaxID=2870721 RepID=UPI003F72E799
MTPRRLVHAWQDLLALLPPGWLARDTDSVMGRVLRAPAVELVRLETSALSLLTQSDPRVATDLLGDFERVLGPDPCDPAGPTTVPERQRVAHQRWTQAGSPTIAFFIALAASRGVAITIEERRPFKAGASKAGHPLAPRTCRFFWLIRLPSTRVIRFRAGASKAGHSLGSIEAVGVECPIRRFAPAHTTPVFAYEGSP